MCVKRRLLRMILGRAAERCPTYIFTLTTPSRIIQYDPSSNRSQLPAGLERTYSPPGTQNLPLAVSHLSFCSSFSTSRAALPDSPSQFVEKLFKSLILLYFAFLIISMKEVIAYSLILYIWCLQSHYFNWIVICLYSVSPGALSWCRQVCRGNWELRMPTVGISAPAQFCLSLVLTSGHLFPQ